MSKKDERMNKTRCVVYCRISGRDVANQKLSSALIGSNIDDQETECRRYADQKGWTVVDVLKEQQETSGAIYFPPKLQEAIDLAAQGKYDVLLCRDMDRLSTRDDTLVKHNLIKLELKPFRVRIAYVNDPDFSDDDYGPIMENMYVASKNQAKRDMLIRLNRGKRRIVENGGVIMNGQPPLGFRLDKDDKFNLLIEPTEASIIKSIFDWYASGLSIGQITDRLNDAKVPTWEKIRNRPQFGRDKASDQWSRASVHWYLSREIYSGSWHYGKHSNPLQSISKNGKVGNVQKFVKNPIDHQIEVSVPLIIDPEIWQIVEERLQQNRHSGRGSKYEYLMSKRLLCVCGYRLSGDPKDNGKRLYYKCRGGTRQHYRENCPHPYLRTDLIDTITWNWLSGLLSDQGKMVDKARSYIQDQEQNLRPYLENRERYDKLLENYQSEYDNLLVSFVKLTGFGQERLLPDLQRVEKQIKETQSLRDKIQNEITDLERNVVSMKKFLFEYDEADSQGEFLLMTSIDGEFVEYHDLILMRNREYNFQEKRKEIEKWDVRGTVFLENDEWYIKLTCSLGIETVEKIVQQPACGQTINTGYYLVFSDTLLLDFSSLPQFQQSKF